MTPDEARAKLAEIIAEAGADVSFGMSQITVAYAPVGDHSASPANVAFVRDYYFQPENAIRDCAAWLGGYWQQFSALDDEQRYYETASRFNGGPAMAFADNPNAANIRAAWAAAAQYEQEAPMPAPTPRTYDADTPSVLQTDAWSCSVASTAWALRALGIDTPYPGLEGTFIAEGLASPSDGLLSASGQPLAAWLRQTYGLTVEVNSDADWAWIAERAGKGPILLGGRHWGGEGHWSGCRGLADHGGVSLANPAPGWGSVWDTLYADAFGARGGWTAIYIQAADEETEVTQAEYDELKAKYDELNNYTSGLGHDILGPTVDQLRALAAASSRTKPRDALQADLNGIADRLADYVVA